MNRKFFISLLLLGGLLVSCQDDILLPEEEVVVVVKEKESTILITDIDALRSVKPTSTSGRPGSAIHDGEKGRDRRDNVDYYGYEGLKIESPTELQVGDLYVTGYDEEKDEYLFKFYWGDEINEEINEMLAFANIYVTFVRKGYGSLVSGKNRTNSGYRYYDVDDIFSFPSDICRTCTDIQIKIDYRKERFLSFTKEWTQSFESLMERYNQNK